MQNKIYQISRDSQYSELYIENESLKNSIIKSFEGDSSNIPKEISAVWYKDKESKLKKADIPFFLGYIPLCNHIIYEKLCKFSSMKLVDFLPITIEEEKYYFLHPRDIKNNILNRQKSKISYFDDNKTISWIYKYVFFPFDPQSDIFKIGEMCTSIFATDNFKYFVESNNITGIRFIECEISKKNLISKLFKL